MSAVARRAVLALGAALSVLAPASAFARDPTPEAALPQAPASPAFVEREMPFRLLDVLRYESARARVSRLYSGTEYMLAGAGIIAAGMLSFATVDAHASNADGIRGYAIVLGGLGTVAIGASLYLMLSPSAAERLERTYAPRAFDPTMPTAVKLREGEAELRALAKKDATQRKFVGVTSIGIGLGVAALAVWRSSWAEATSTDRTVSLTLTSVSALVAIGAGISQLWFQRGSAEVALAHWEASQGRLTTTARVVPVLAPMPGGLSAGVIIVM